MIVGIVVLSSFNVPKTNEEIVLLQNSDGGWTRVGKYRGYESDGTESAYKFTIWEKKDMCNSYYWVYYEDTDPDNVTSSHNKGVLRQNSDGKWYAALNGFIYYIDF